MKKVAFLFGGNVKVPYICNIKLINQTQVIMAKRKRIVRVNGRQNVQQDTFLRRLFEQFGGCSMSVRLELQRREFQAKKKHAVA